MGYFGDSSLLFWAIWHSRLFQNVSTCSFEGCILGSCSNKPDCGQPADNLEDTGRSSEPPSHQMGPFAPLYCEDAWDFLQTGKADHQSCQQPFGHRRSGRDLPRALCRDVQRLFAAVHFNERSPRHKQQPDLVIAIASLFAPDVCPNLHCPNKAGMIINRLGPNADLAKPRPYTHSRSPNIESILAYRLHAAGRPGFPREPCKTGALRLREPDFEVLTQTWGISRLQGSDGVLVHVDVAGRVVEAGLEPRLLELLPLPHICERIEVGPPRYSIDRGTPTHTTP